jgi:hypothetical protein
MDDKFIENRKYIRHPSDIPIEISSQAADPEEKNTLNNVSFGGLCFRSAVAYAGNTVVAVRITYVRPVFEAKGRVVWCKGNPDGSFDVGLEFAGAVDAFRARMVEQICRIEQYKREVLEKEGRSLSGTQAAREWIDKYAEKF